MFDVSTMNRMIEGFEQLNADLYWYGKGGLSYETIRTRLEVVIKHDLKALQDSLYDKQEAPLICQQIQEIIDEYDNLLIDTRIWRFEPLTFLHEFRHLVMKKYSIYVYNVIENYDRKAKDTPYV